MRSCIFSVYLTLVAGGIHQTGAVLTATPAWPAGRPAAAPEVALPADEDPDRLYDAREDLAAAARAAAIWEARLAANPRDFESAWKAARVRCWLGDRSSADRKREYARGAEAARAAVRMSPNRPEGPFWLGANLGGLATVSGRLTGLRLRGDIKSALETSVRLDPGYSKGVGFCALGKYYHEVPALFGGSERKAEQLLRRCISYDPDSTIGHYYLAQVLFSLGRREDARAALRTVIDAPADPDHLPESMVWKRKAARLLARNERAK